MAFKPLSYLENAAKSKNIKDIRRALRSYIKKCLGDTQEIKEALNYVKKSLTEEEYNNIWEKYDGLKLDKDSNNWDKRYFASLEVDLSDNFSKERFNHILEVGKFVYGTTEKSQSPLNESDLSLNKVNSVDKKDGKSNFLLLMIICVPVLVVGIYTISKILKK